MSEPRSPGTTALSDLDLLARARDGDGFAFRVLVDRYQPQVAATAVGMLGAGAEAEDVGQETFIRFYQALDSFRGDAELGYFLRRIAMNLSLNAIKRRKRWRRVFMSSDQAFKIHDPPMERQTADELRHLAEQVHQVIQRLNPKVRAVAVLRLVERCSTEETARVLNIPYGTVLSRQARAVRKIREMLNADAGPRHD